MNRTAKLIIAGLGAIIIALAVFVVAKAHKDPPKPFTMFFLSNGDTVIGHMDGTWHGYDKVTDQYDVVTNRQTGAQQLVKMSNAGWKPSFDGLNHDAITKVEPVDPDSSVGKLLASGGPKQMAQTRPEAAPQSKGAPTGDQQPPVFKPQVKEKRNRQESNH